MTALPEHVQVDLNVAIDELEAAVVEVESRIESARAERDEAKGRQVELEIENANLRRELELARDRQDASAEILRSIAGTSGDAEHSLRQIAETSARLFGATSATIHIAEGDDWAQTIRVGDSSKRIGVGVPEAQLRIGGRNMPGTIVAENRQVHVPDLDNVDAAIADWPGLPYARAAGTRSMAGAPLRLEGKAIGALIVYRDRLAPFTDEELALQQSFADQAAIAIENARLFNETREALERQTATAEILKVIASSPSDVQPVFEAIAERSNRLIEGLSTAVYTLVDDIQHLMAFTRTSPAADAALEALFPRPLSAVTAWGDQIRNGEIVHIPDSEVEWAGQPSLLELSRLRGFRSALLVPLLRNRTPIGLISVTRREPGAFGAHHVQLLQTFADQAVIAIENVRLFNETREALERQTATADILKVIASSPSDTTPVFGAIATSANRLLGGFSTAVFRFLDGKVHLASFTPVSPAADAALKADFPRPVDEFEAFRLAQQGEPFPIPDTEGIPHAPIREIARLHGFRSMLFVPLMNGGMPIGIISITRLKPGTFSPNHIQLLQTFADQAVIAIENTRLFNETREALERQTATAEILRVIASSPSDVQPVFDVIVERAVQLCGARIGRVYRYDGNLIHLVGGHGLSEPGRDSAQRPFPRPASDDTIVGRVMLSRQPGILADLDADDTVPPLSRRMIGAIGARSQVTMPMLLAGEPIGAITLSWAEPRGYTDHQIALLQTFADQAVIAIENVRLFNEVKQRTEDLSKSLQQQTATADVLKVISRSAFDLEAVMNTLASSAAELCGASMSAVYHREGDLLVARGISAIDEKGAHFLRHNPPQINDETFIGRAVLTGSIANIADTESETGGNIRRFSIALGYKALLILPLMREDRGVGAFALARDQVGAFTPRQIELVQTFADQAVIAIENVRLFDEVQAKTRDLSEALTYQTGSGNILKVIASSPTDVGPVLEAIVRNACELCDAYDAAVLLRDGDDLRFNAHHGPIPIGLEKWPINRRWTAGRAFIDQTPVHVRDLRDEEHADFSDGRELSLRMGHRSILSVPLLREGESIGAIVLRRTEVHPFSDKQIALLQTFADQAVIAIGNVHLFEEVQARTRDLSESLQQQTATADVLKVISRSAFDLQPVLDVIVETSRELCGADASTIFLLRDRKFHVTAVAGALPTHLEFMRSNPSSVDQPGSILSRVAREKRTLHYPNVADDPELSQGMTGLGGPRALLSVPLMRDEEVIGAITLRQSHLKPFTDRQIEAIETFADQAVIAIENVRLFDEVEARTRDLSESLQQQTATADVLKVISTSSGELEPVFQAMLENAGRLCEAKFAMLFLYEENQFRAVGRWNIPPAYSEFLEKNTIIAHPKIPLGRVATTKQPVQVEDVLLDPSYMEGFPGMVGVAELGGARTLLQVPMLKDNQLVGTIGIYRQEVRPFTDKQIALVQNFAAQAVIAIENARLLNELRQRTDDLTGSLNDLRTAQDRLVQTEKLASLGQLTAGIAHEIKNPLNFVNNFAALSAELTDELNEVLKPVPFEDNIRKEVGELTGLLKENLEKVVQHGKRADSIVKNMLLHSREGSGDHRPADINALLEESLNLAYHGARAEKPAFNVTLQRDFDPAAGTIEIFPQEITRVFLNLISNGFYAVTRRKAELGEADFDPLLSATTQNLGDSVEIRIRDNGTGIPPEVKEKMFNPFFTTKPAGEGTGLGLSMSHDIIVKQHGGSIDVATEPGQFTEFIIVLPRASHLNDRNRGQT